MKDLKELLEICDQIVANEIKLSDVDEKYTKQVKDLLDVLFKV